MYFEKITSKHACPIKSAFFHEPYSDATRFDGYKCRLAKKASHDLIGWAKFDEIHIEECGCKTR